MTWTIDNRRHEIISKLNCGGDEFKELKKESFFYDKKLKCWTSLGINMEDLATEHGNEIQKMTKKLESLKDVSKENKKLFSENKSLKLENRNLENGQLTEKERKIVYVSYPKILEHLKRKEDKRDSDDKLFIKLKEFVHKNSSSSGYNKTRGIILEIDRLLKRAVLTEKLEDKHG